MSERPDFKALIAEAATGQPLSSDRAEVAFDMMMSGNATPAQMGGFLMALRVRGESVAEIAGAVRTMRAKALMIEAPPGAIDIVGTGGDATGTLNISTASAIVVAACGVPVAKHGNRALSSKSGAADVLTALGVNIEADMELVKRSLHDVGLCFLMAPRHHGAMRNVGPTRVELGTRTIFNLLGPLSNPAGVKRQLVGTFDRKWLVPMAEVLRELGSERIWVVHGSDGTDEITTTGRTHVAELKDGKIAEFDLLPEDAGVKRATLQDIKGGDAETNALALNALLDGHVGPYRDIVLMNAGASLVIAGKAADIRAGAALAAKAIDEGRARKTLERMIAIVGRPKPPSVPPAPPAPKPA
jgi:anthranilate phosphoribosyltransferase